MGGCALLAVWLAMAMSATEGLNLPRDEVVRGGSQGASGSFMKDGKTDLGEVHGGAVSLSAEDGPAVYHKLPGGDLPEYATILKVLDQGHDGCKKACDADGQCEGYKFNPDEQKHRCKLLKHKQNFLQVKAKAGASLVKEVKEKMKRTVVKAALATGPAVVSLRREEAALQAAKRKTELAKQKAKVNAGNIDAKVKEYAKSTQAMTAKKEQLMKQLQELYTEKARVKAKADAKLLAAEKTEGEVAAQRATFKDKVKNRVKKSLGFQLESRKKALKEKMANMKVVAKNELDQARDEFERLRKQADEYKLAYEELKAAGPQRQELPPVATPIDVEKAGDAINTGKSNPLVAEAVAEADKKAVTKAKNQEFMAKTAGIKNTGPSEADLKKTEEEKAQKAAMVAVEGQKAEVKNIAKKAEDTLKKASMDPQIKGELEGVVKEATSEIEVTADKKKLDEAEIEAERKMSNILAKKEEADANAVQKDQSAKAKQLADKISAIEGAQKEWLAKTLARFPPKDQPKYLPRLKVISLKIRKEFPSSERLEILNSEANAFISKVRRKEYDADQMAKDAQVVALRSGGNATLAMEEMHKLMNQTKVRRKERENGKQSQELLDAVNKADAKQDMIRADKALVKVEQKLANATNEVKAVDVEKRAEDKKVASMEEKVKALEEIKQKGEPATKVTDEVDKKGKIIKQDVKSAPAVNVKAQEAAQVVKDRKKAGDVLAKAPKKVPKKL